MNFDFDKIIQKNRELRNHAHFEGTCLDYLKVVKNKPETTMLAHERMYELISQPGVETINTENCPRLRRIYENDKIKKYKFFNDFYGIDKTIMEIVRFFHSATM